MGRYSARTYPYFIKGGWVMARWIFNMFKTIAFAMVLVFVLDMAFYLYKALNLNQRMESVCVSLQKVVSENNYLPEGEYKMFENIFDGIGKTMNGIKVTDSISDADQNFIIWDKSGGKGSHAVRLNYKKDASSTDIPAMEIPVYDKNSGGTVKKNVVHTRLDKPADYGDVMYIEAKVKVKMPIWRFTASKDKLNADSWGRDEDLNNKNTTTFTYNYLVPCLKYQSVTN